jgi:Tol biopolymer transport system component
MRTSAFAFTLAMSTLVVSPAALGSNPDTPTIEQSLNLKTAQAPRISADGRYVAYQVQSANWEDNSFQSELWIAVVASGDRYQLTYSKKDSVNPSWSPDSGRIAFLSDRAGKRQIYLISPWGGRGGSVDKGRNWSECVRMVAGRETNSFHRL